MEDKKTASKERRKKVKEIVKEINVKKRTVALNKQRETMLEQQIKRDENNADLLDELECIKIQITLDELDIIRFDSVLRIIHDEDSLMGELFRYKYIDRIKVIGMEAKTGCSVSTIHRTLAKSEEMFIKFMEV